MVISSRFIIKPLIGSQLGAKRKKRQLRNYKCLILNLGYMGSLKGPPEPLINKKKQNRNSSERAGLIS